MSRCAICSPVWRFLHHVIISCKGSIKVDLSGTPRPVSWHARKRVFFSFNDVTTLSLSSYLFRSSIGERRRSQRQRTINSLRKNKTSNRHSLHSFTLLKSVVLMVLYSLHLRFEWCCTPRAGFLNGPARPARVFKWSCMPCAGVSHSPGRPTRAFFMATT